jgi:hypothetical protein
MADQYSEDSASKAESAVEWKTAKEAVDEDVVVDGGSDTEEPEQLPIKPLGSWAKCKVKNKDLLAPEKEGRLLRQNPKLWTDHKAAELAPHMTKILMLKSHVEWGLIMLSSHFFSNLLQFYGVRGPGPLLVSATSAPL